jgi:hypothetical protein
MEMVPLFFMFLAALFICLGVILWGWDGGVGCPKGSEPGAHVPEPRNK